MEKQKWLRELESIYLRYHAKNSHDITGLYIDIERASEKYFVSGEIREGDTFDVSLTNGAKLVFEFYPQTTALYLQDVDEDNRRETLIDKADDAQKEYSQLKALGTMLHMTGDFIGEKYPAPMRELLLSLENGEVISFTDGKTYASGGLRNDVLSLIEVYDGNLINLRPEYLKSRETLIRIYENKDLQKFYNENCKHLTERLEYNITKLDKAKEAVIAAEESAKEAGSKAFHMGNVTLLAKVSKDGNSINWYDSSMVVVDRDNIILLNAILNNQIRERKYVRNTDNLCDLADDKNLEQVLEILSVKKEYVNMYNVISDRVKGNSGALTLDFKLIKKENDMEYTPIKISFMDKEGVARCYVSTYKNNDFSQDISHVQELSQGEFKSICERLYDRNHEILRTRTEDTLIKKYLRMREKPTAVQQKIIEDAAEKQIKAEQVHMVPFKFSVTDKDVVELIDNFNKGKNELSAKDILKKVKNNEEYER